MPQDNFYIVHGPPGTGKTTYLTTQATHAVEKHGSDKVIIASLTRAAAHEIGSRGIPIQSDHIGTLHKMCYHELGRPNMAESQIKEWNKEFPHLAMSSAVDMDEPTGQPSKQASKGDAYLLEYTLERSRCDQTIGSYSMQNFIKNWEEWKKENELMDFTDLLEQAIEDVALAPGAPEIMIGDEAQDWSKLEMKLFRDCWGKFTEKIILAGDGDQALYTWRGADPSIFNDPSLDKSQQKELKQSYRVPKEPHALAQRIIRTIDERRDVDYHPKDNPGSVEYSNASVRRPDYLMNFVEEEISQDRSVMILASCSFFLNKTISTLKENAIPYHNPYRTKRGDWNPLKQGTPKRVTTCDRLISFMTQPSWSREDVRRIIHVLKADIFTRGSKKLLEELQEDDPPMSSFAGALKDIEMMNQINERSMTWFRNHMLPTWQKKFVFCSEVVKKRGIEALKTGPKVIVGTIHSVKGGEADTVIIYPDLSMAGYKQWKPPHIDQGRESIVRMFYVAVTRTRDKLVICKPSGLTYPKGLF
jgi:superfamily I DNA/RNA helicase